MMNNTRVRKSNAFDIIQVGSLIALYSRPNSIELFYLSKVVGYGVAEDKLINKNNYIILEEDKYIKYKYFQKAKEGKAKIFYKHLNDEALVYPPQVMATLVNLSSDSYFSIEEYQWYAIVFEFSFYFKEMIFITIFSDKIILICLPLFYLKMFVTAYYFN